MRTCATNATYRGESILSYLLELNTVVTFNQQYAGEKRGAT
jgi:hypothetical protein